MAENQNQGRRRYKVGVNPEYDSIFDWLVMKSLILNPSGAGANDIQNYGTVAMLRSKTGIQRLLDEHRGQANDEKRAYVLNRKKVPSKLAKAETAIKSVEEKFEKLKQREVNSGHHPPEQMPDEMQEELLRAEAAHDIVKAEISRLETALENFPNQDEDGRMPCLKHGCIGSGKKRGGVLVILDGQSVFPDSENVLRIKDSRSPYNGMLTADYFEKIVTTYKQQLAKLSELYQAEISEAKKTGKDPASLPKQRPPFPDWPKDVEKYDWSTQNT